MLSRVFARLFSSARVPIAVAAVFVGSVVVFASVRVSVQVAVPFTSDPAGETDDPATTQVEPPPVAAETAHRAADADDYLSRHYPDLERVYRHLHSNPELSHDEYRTAVFLSGQLAGTDFEITRGFGGGNGFVAVLRNGAGPTVLVRTEMDALPVEEKTGLPFASKVQTRDRDGNLVGVMHACGHDVHMACWAATARLLAGMRDQWHGTLVFIAQPAEEAGAGAHRMIQAGLLTKFPRPDYCLALHCDPQSAAGSVAYTPGLAMANIDMVEIVVRGKGGHGAWPHMTVDPVVLAARLILDLQTLVSRENNPTDPLVVTVGTIHGGVKANVIPNDVTLQLTVRTTKEVTRKHVLEGIARMANATAAGANAPPPTVRIRTNWHMPAVQNDPHLLETTVAALRDTLGDAHVGPRPPMMGGEDFALFAKAGVPSCLLFLGTQDPGVLAKADSGETGPPPSLHSDRFAPVVEPTLRTGVRAMTAAVLNIVGNHQTGAAKLQTASR